jgi:hypothetical protein
VYIVDAYSLVGDDETTRPLGLCYVEVFRKQMFCIGYTPNNYWNKKYNFLCCTIEFSPIMFFFSANFPTKLLLLAKFI